jgi:predicted nucleic acid-binding protein
MTAVDTNVLFYAHDSRDRRKQRIAVDLIASISEGVLLWQVACEYLWASRKLESQGYSYADALADVRSIRRVWGTVLPVWEVLDRSRLSSRGTAFLTGTRF